MVHDAPKLLLLAVVPSLPGCSGAAACDPAVEQCGTGDTATRYDGSVKLLQYDHGCCGPGEDRCPGIGAWWIDVVTEGAAPQVRFSVLEAALPSALRWSETHDVPVTFSDPDGYWTDHYLEVEVARTTDCSSLRACADRFSSGANTLFACPDDLAADGLQVKVEIFDGQGNELACESVGATGPDAPGCEP